MKSQSELNAKLEMRLEQSGSNGATIKRTIAQVFTRIRALVSDREQQLIDKIDAIEAKNQRSIQEHQDVL